MRTLFQSTQKTERECAFCVLKNQNNMIKKKRNPRVLFKNVAYKLSEIEGKTLLFLDLGIQKFAEVPYIIGSVENG